MRQNKKKDVLELSKQSKRTMTVGEMCFFLSVSDTHFKLATCHNAMLTQLQHLGKFWQIMLY